MRLGVIIYTQGQILFGYVNLLSKERFSDLLNYVFDGNQERHREFIQVDDVTIKDTSGRLEGKRKTIYIRKSSILFVATEDDNSYRDIGGRGSNQNNLFIEKMPVFVTLTLPSYELMGYVHCTSAQTPLSLLEERLGFLPLTDVKILVPKTHMSWTYPFAGVNKEQIVSLVIATSDSQKTSDNSNLPQYLYHL